MKYVVLLLALMFVGCGGGSTNEKVSTVDGELVEGNDDKEDIAEDNLESVSDIDRNK